ncbi:hypothetical protein HDU96_002718 [Phlyctochytrium bullatum]|nr:hypothetical protein HDU96_002718 [Phlyctochytrium bullatum]
MTTNNQVFFRCIDLCPDSDKQAFWAISMTLFNQCPSLPPAPAGVLSTPVPDPNAPLWGAGITTGNWWGPESTIPVAPATFVTMDVGTFAPRPTSGVTFDKAPTATALPSTTAKPASSPADIKPSATNGAVAGLKSSSAVAAAAAAALALAF